MMACDVSDSKRKWSSDSAVLVSGFVFVPILGQLTSHETRRPIKSGDDREQRNPQESRQHNIHMSFLSTHRFSCLIKIQKKTG
jgi:hypothetical protein